MNQTDFCAKYRLAPKALETCGLTWNELEAIATDYTNYRSNLEPTATYIADRLRYVKEVHSLKIRTKDPEHLVEKIIRKRLENPSKNINIENYKTEITDLIGVRALHLFKDDWMPIHDFIMSTWETYETPIAYYRRGDSADFLKQFIDKNCNPQEHKFGYRSVHYLLKSQPAKVLHIAEVQVRTIFEEGWSEINHSLRYPYHMDDPILKQYLLMFNRLAGFSDEMGSFIKFLSSELERKEKMISDLSKQIDELNIAEKQKSAIKKNIIAISLASPIWSFATSGATTALTSESYKLTPNLYSPDGPELLAYKLALDPFTLASQLVPDYLTTISNSGKVDDTTTDEKDIS
jgi:ppGpp synthetase/RelA/SpoT-type nucleotidyltranferase